MLRELSIHNIILIEKQTIPFAPGLCVLTGETGAGKSIILDALGLCLGARGSSKLVRQGATMGSVAAEFTVEEDSPVFAFLDRQGIPSDSVLRLRRVVYADGKTRAFINDTPVGVQLLAEIAAYLVEIHGQHDQRLLMEIAMHRMMLDEFVGLSPLKKQVELAFRALDARIKECDALTQALATSVAEEDYLRFVVKELLALHPEVGEEEGLSAKRRLLLQGEKLREAISFALGELKDADLEARLLKISRVLSAGEWASTFSLALEALERALIEVREAEAQIEMVASSVQHSEHSLQTIEDRLYALKDAARKHRVEIDQLPVFLEQMQVKLERITHGEEALVAARTALNAAREKFIQAAECVRSERFRAAEKLEQEMLKELAPLKMEHTVIRACVDPLPESEWSSEGMDRVQFLARTNPGQPLAPLHKIASGGELSRFMLALKAVMHRRNQIPTLIFDEVDTGIGGAVADAVGKRLQLLAQNAQVLVVTHQPQVAARGNYHLKIRKSANKDSVQTEVSVLEPDLREEEIARMLSGERITSEARAAAQKLLEVA